MADKPSDPSTEHAADAAPPRSKKKLFILLGVGLLAVIGVGAYFATAKHGPTPADQLAELLALVDEGSDSVDARMKARELLKEFEKTQFVDSEFPAAVPFVRGLLELADAQEIIGEGQQPKLLNAVSELEDTRLRVVPPERQPHVTYALGVALQMLGLRTRARPELEAAYESYAPGKSEVGRLLVANYLEDQTEPSLQRVLTLTESLLEDDELSDDTREQLTIQRAQALHSLGQVAEAEQLLAQHASPTGTTHEATLIRARALMSEAEALERQKSPQATAKWDEARELLATLFKPLVSETVVSRAFFLTARCASRAGNIDVAIEYYEQTRRRFPHTHEAVAAAAELAGILRQLERDEEALEAYLAVLHSIRRPEDFCNRWLTRREFQRMVMDAWSAWIAAGQFTDALTIADQLGPLFDHLRSRELVAETNQRWAQHLDREFETASEEKRRSLKEELHKRWSECGDAYSKLAHVVRFTTRYEDIIWQSTASYAKGQRFEKSAEMASEFLRGSPKLGVPRAHVHRGIMLAHLDRPRAALEDFQYVAKFFPTDPAVFEAQLWSGHVYLEQNRLAEAEQAYRRLLAANELDPAAKEWRQAKFSLSRLLIERATDEQLTTITRDNAPLTDSQQKAQQAALVMWSEAIRHLDEYVRRYPQGEDRYEARALLARALRASTARPRSQLQESLPASARRQVVQEIEKNLNRAIQELRTLQDELQVLQSSGRLDELAYQLYRDTFAQIPDIQFEMDLYEDALDSYRTITNRFPDHPMILTAYVQMARCYDRLDRSQEAAEQLEQAKLTLARLPDQAFQLSNSGMNRTDWSDWLTWAEKTRNKSL